MGRPRTVFYKLSTGRDPTNHVLGILAQNPKLELLPSQQPVMLKFFLQQNRISQNKNGPISFVVTELHMFP
ncbi:hypothetical protein QJS04_geneDACA012603 [Acorus gramineus]|uniref:Uncharacterized protein n=1 Tax=Acorus gramineus TaxID=55184 RepID=A0AAV9B2I3_ACOGR|nr:hypothetical protein QJS04_geneDACA012603 [Acorus gramineus]